MEEEVLDLKKNNLPELIDTVARLKIHIVSKISYSVKVRLFCSVGMRNCMRRSVLGNENVHAKCDESADGGEK